MQFFKRWFVNLKEKYLFYIKVCTDAMETLLHHPELKGSITPMLYKLRWVILVGVAIRFAVHFYSQDPEMSKEFFGISVLYFIIIALSLYAIYLTILAIHKKHLKNAPYSQDEKDRFVNRYPDEIARRIKEPIFSKRYIWLQIIMDSVFYSAFYLLTQEIQSDFFLFYFLPLLLAVEHFSVFVNIIAFLVILLCFSSVIIIFSPTVDFSGSRIFMNIWLPRFFAFSILSVPFVWYSHIKKTQMAILEAIVEECPEGITIIGMPKEKSDGSLDEQDMQVLYFNKAQKKYTRDPRCLRRSCYYEFDSPRPEERRCRWCPTIDSLKHGTKARNITTSIGPTNREGQYDVSSAPLLNERKKIIAAFESVKEITALMQFVNLLKNFAGIIDPNQVLELTVKGLYEMFKADFSLIAKLEDNRLHVEAVYPKDGSTDVISKGSLISIENIQQTLGSKSLEDRWEDWLIPSNDPDITDITEMMNITRGLMIPISDGNSIWGFIVVGFPSIEAPKRLDVVLCQAAADLFWVAYQRALLYESQELELRRRETELKSLQQIDEAVISRCTLDVLIKLIVDKGRQIIGSGCVYLYLWDHESGYLILHDESGEHPGKIQEKKQQSLTTSGLVDMSNIQCINNVDENLGYKQELIGTQTPEEREFLSWVKSEVQVSLTIGKTFIGIIVAVKPFEGGFTDSDMLIFKELAARATSSIEDSRLLQEKSRFLIHASHSLKGPLTPIIAYTEMLLSEERDEVTKKRFLEIILRESHNLNRMIEESLEAARIDTVGLESKEQYFSVLNIINGTVRRFTALTGVDIEVTGTLEVDGVWGKPDSFAEVLRCLLDNAIKYTTKESWARVHLQSDCEKIQISVIDRGIGMLKEELKSVFEPFQRGSAQKRLEHEIPGTGLGLYICKEIIENMGGSITMDSKPNKGTIVNIMLPISHKKTND